MPRFRNQLRDATAERHRKLDARIGAIDLSSAAGRASFQRIHDRANGRVFAACGGDAAEATDYLMKVSGRSADTRAAEPVPYALSVHPDAAAYVMLGSQLGLAYIRSSLPEPHRTGVLQHEPDLASWHAFLDRIAATPPQGALRDRILRDSVRVFDIFLAVADQTLSAHEPETE